jgi:hypothetical protein
MPFVVDQSGNVFVGTPTDTSIGGGIGRIAIASTGSTWIKNTRFSADAGGPTIGLAKSRNATVDGQTVVQSGDSIGALAFYGSDGTQFLSAANIIANVDGTPGTNDMPGRLIFSTTPDGSASPTERMRIDSAGNVNIGSGTPAGGGTNTGGLSIAGKDIELMTIMQAY